MDRVDRQYLDIQFNNVYAKIDEQRKERDDQHSETLREIKVICIQAGRCDEQLKKTAGELEEHKTETCDNIQVHYTKYHELSWGKVIGYTLTILTIITSVIIILEKVI